jgi:RND family efflux transporter MFP subunit
MMNRYASVKKLYQESLGQKLARINSIMAGIVLLGLIFLPWVQTSRGQGKVSAYNPNDRELKIDAAVDGRIVQWHIQEGDEVKEGDTIAEMADFDPQIIERLQSERDALTKRFEAARKATEISKRNLDRQKKLFLEGLSARREFERAEIDYTSHLAAEAAASAELTRIDTRLSRQSNQFIRAPRAGIISRIVAREGTEIVKSGEVIAILVPLSVQRSVELYLNPIDLPLVLKGQKVRLQFEGWPSIQFSGWPSVAVGTFPGVIANVDPSVDQKTGMFRVLVLEEPGQRWPEERFLRQGMRARGWIQLNTVALGYELWRNFNGFPPTIEKPEESNSGEKP